MKLICVEEHLLDPDIGKASGPLAVAEAPYLPDWGIRVSDGAQVDTPRPHVLASADSTRLGLAPVSQRLADMDGAGIDMQVLSYGGFPQLLPPAQAVDLCRAANDRLAAIIADHPTRFAGFATLPWQAPEAAAQEMDRAARMGLKGTLINGRPGADFLDAPRYAPVLEALNRLQLPLYIHPGLPLQAVQQPYYGGFERELTARLSMFAWGWHNEAGVLTLRLLLSGAFDRWPDLRVISGHWGEMVPFFLQRLEDSIPVEASGLSRGIVETYRQHVYVSPSGMLTEPHFRFIHSVMGADRILYSVDYPYQSLNGARDFLDRLEISDTDRALIAHGNTERLLGIAP
ncbi:MAG: amidohydrolase family protein [Paracoccus sp. (in: a-proteobacteria)]|uniref:amidohydrolase family protein n=1 Tax=Paracoccus sp. TaxID=267 RepID=UPI0026E00A0B|nr:amidohydrolase family protein [Paracoccus sp. (in: a-proteobacteria)]MDO5622698.1 amidohydrolase family protein [Paracoccus sp. (in: a-proteobacteria)]